MAGGGNQGKRDQSTTPSHRKPALPAPGSHLLCSFSPLDPLRSGSAPPSAAERDRGGARSNTNPPVTLLKGNFLLAAPHSTGYCVHRGGSTAPHLPPTREPFMPSFTFCHIVLLSITSSSSSTAASSPGGCCLPFSRQCCLYRSSITLAEERAGLTHPQRAQGSWAAPGQSARVPGSSQIPPWGSSQPSPAPHYTPLTCVGRRGRQSLQGLLANCPAVLAPGIPSRVFLSNAGGSRPRPGASALGSPSSAG